MPAYALTESTARVLLKIALTEHYSVLHLEESKHDIISKDDVSFVFTARSSLLSAHGKAVCLKIYQTAASSEKSSSLHEYQQICNRMAEQEYASQAKAHLIAVSKCLALKVACPFVHVKLRDAPAIGSPAYHAILMEHLKTNSVTTATASNGLSEFRLSPLVAQKLRLSISKQLISGLFEFWEYGLLYYEPSVRNVHIYTGGTFYHMHPILDNFRFAARHDEHGLGKICGICAASSANGPHSYGHMRDVLHETLSQLLHGNSEEDKRDIQTYLDAHLPSTKGGFYGIQA